MTSRPVPTFHDPAWLAKLASGFNPWACPEGGREIRARFSEAPPSAMDGTPEAVSYWHGFRGVSDPSDFGSDLRHGAWLAGQARRYWQCAR